MLPLFLRLVLVAVAVGAVADCGTVGTATLQPPRGVLAPAVTLTHGDLRAVFVDNQPYSREHRAGYNGIAELYHPAQAASPFVPAYAGFNLEHIFGGDVLAELFEPRRHPMTLYQTSDREVILHQAATPLSHVESQTAFRLVSPHYIDVTFRAVLKSTEFFRHGYAGLFWASYIDRAPDARIFFQGVDPENTQEQWISASSPKHGTDSTHVRTTDRHTFHFAPDFNATLANHFSAYRYTVPFYFGRFHNMALAFLFDSPHVIRFSQSPTGGGASNPAWDFQLLIPEPRADRPYELRARIVYKPFVSHDDIADEYRRWRRMSQ